MEEINRLKIALVENNKTSKWLSDNLSTSQLDRFKV